jgi:hypothetical protein
MMHELRSPSKFVLVEDDNFNFLLPMRQLSLDVNGIAQTAACRKKSAWTGSVSMAGQGGSSYQGHA